MIFDEQLLKNPALRWGGAFTLVVGTYAAAGITALNWPAQANRTSALPLAAMMVELAPIPAAPPISTPQEPAPEPVREPIKELTPPPPAPIPEPVAEIEPLPEMPVVKEAIATLPPPADPAREKPDLVEKQLPAQQQPQPTKLATPPTKIAKAPRQGAVSLSSSPVTWKSLLLGHLEKYKRYPRQAHRRQQEAIVYVRVTINRKGMVIDTQLTKPSAHATLNRETLALIKRAQPLPPPPAEIGGETVEFVVPVAFSLKS